MHEINAPAPLPIVPADILNRFHVSESYDTRYASCARLLQSIWRERRGFPVGKAKTARGRRRPLGSRLTTEYACAGANFLSRDIARLVRREAAYREYGALIEEERLWGNLLASQPLTLYLFGRAKLDRSLGTRFFRTLFPDFVAELDTIDFETSPGRGDERFTGDTTALDLRARVTTPRGTRALIAIEVKFSESMECRARPTGRRYDELADLARLHRDPHAAALREAPLEQLFRLHLLASTMVADPGPYQEGLFVLIAPHANRDVARAAEAYRTHLRDDHVESLEFRQVSVEACIAAMATAGDTELSAALHERYTDFEPVHTLIEEWEPHKQAGME